MNSLEQAAKACLKELCILGAIPRILTYGSRCEAIIAKHMEAFAREREKLKAVGRIVKHIESICDKCGHTTTEDGCAFCIKEQNRELLKSLKNLLACHHEGALLCSTIENAKKVNEIETHAMKVVVNTEALDKAALAKGDGHCHAGSDGECHWESCPQLRDNEPNKSGRHCPLDLAKGDRGE